MNKSDLYKEWLSRVSAILDQIVEHDRWVTQAISEIRMSERENTFPSTVRVAYDFFRAGVMALCGAVYLVQQSLEKGDD